MVTIISQYPNQKNERDGMVQRIAAIDNLLKEKDRRYLEISLRKNWTGLHVVENGVNIYILNLFKHFFLISKLLRESNYIYVHSIYNALRIFIFYFFFNNIITDLHGVVPDELALCDENIKSKLYGWIEKITMRYSYRLIAVTEAMSDYYIKKYPETLGKFIFISIFADKRRLQRSERKQNGVIYSGGTQKWQCTDKLLQIIKATTCIYDWTILTGNPSYFNGVKRDKVLVRSVKPNEVSEYYGQNTFGIILREDSIVNKVACPTKLIEYIQTGLIPVVLTPHIGDFYKYGYRYVNYDDFKNGKLPSLEALEDIRLENYKILENIMKKTRQNINQLRADMSC